MIYYIVPIIIGFVFSFYEVKFGGYTLKNKTFQKLFIFASAFIYCGGYMTGSDWVNYELLYDQASLSNLKYYTKELGFYYLVLIFKWIGFGFFPFLILCKFTVFYIIGNFLKEHFKSFYLPFTIFLASNALFIFVDNPLRFMLALGVIVLSYKYLLTRKIIPYFILVSIATLFHISSAIMLIAYMGSHLIITKKWITILLYITIFILLTPSLLGGLIEQYVTPYFLSLEYYIAKVPEKDFNYFSIGRIVYLIFFLIVVIKRDVIQRFNNYGEIFYKFTILFFYISLLSRIPTLFRLSIFFAPFLYLSISIILISQFQFKVIIKYFVISYFIFSPIKDIYNSWVYIPYSNYFISLIKNDLHSYEYRKNFNKSEYFKRKGEWPE
ncbi:MAG: EpsG family protein [Prolixibacteraceae bacterium]|nr:EpsG family protein [Prolixibacteraceae bacterium]